MDKQEALNKQDALTKLAALEAETKALRAIIEASEAPPLPVRWRPRAGENYYQLMVKGDIQNFDVELTDTEYAYGNCFQFVGHAEIVVRAVSQTLKVCAAAFAVDPYAGPRIPKERYWSVTKRDFRSTGKAEWVFGEFDVTTSHAIYVHTEQQAKQMADMLNAEGV